MAFGRPRKPTPQGRLRRRRRESDERLGGRMDFRKTAMTTMPSLPPAAARPPRVSALRARPAASDTNRSATRTNTKARVRQLPPAPFLVPLCAICAERRAMRRFRALSCRGALSCFAPERIRRMRRSGGETAKTASAQCRARRKSKRQARSSAVADDASPQRRSRAFGREFSWFGPKGQAEQAANAQFQPTNPRFLAAMKNQG